MKTDFQKLGRRNKRKGARRERQAKKILEEAGYYVVKAGASLGEFDLLAVGQKQLRMIQVKSNYCSPQEKEILELFEAPDYAIKELWIFKDRIKKPLITILK